MCWCSDAHLQRFSPEVRGDVENFGMIHVLSAVVLLHRKLVIDVVVEICAAT